MNPIFDALTRGEQFPFHLLKNEGEATELFWEWWWENEFDGTLKRPKTISDEDPLLIHTATKSSVDTSSDDHLFCSPLRRYLDTNRLPRGIEIPREEYRQRLIDSQLSKLRNAEEKVILFTGGGYGAGKTECVQFASFFHGFQLDQIFGVDYFKQLLPEYNLVKGMSDGRASEICQTECRLIADRFFQQAVDQGKSFGWDNSMSNFAATKAKIDHALANGYRLILIAVLTNPAVAIQRAMIRARETGRFAPPAHLEQSHRDFCESLMAYIPFFDQVIIFENSSDDDEPMHIGGKLSKQQNLEIVDGEALSRYV